MALDVKSFLANEPDEPDKSAPAEARSSAAAENVSGANALATGSDEAGKSVLGAELEAAASKSIAKLNEVLDIPLDPERTHYQAELRSRTALINTALSTQARVDETRMRPQRISRLDHLIELIRQEEARLPKEYIPPHRTAEEADEEARLARLLTELRSIKPEGEEPDG
jgi:hypothetical protein